MNLTPSALSEFKRFTLESSAVHGEPMVPTLVFCFRLRHEGGTTEVNGAWGDWEIGTYCRKDIPSQFLRDVTGIEVVLEDGPYAKDALLGHTVDFTEGKWNVFKGA